MTENFYDRLAASLVRMTPQRARIAGTRAAAVLIPIVARPEPSLILTLRTNTLPSHRGQISFPGGSIDPGDASAVAAALREAHEEIGLDPVQVGVLGELDSMPTYVTGYVITPIVGWIDSQPSLEPNPAEVAEVLTVPLSQLTDSMRRGPGFEHGGRAYPTEAWLYGDHVIWGVTARLLRTFLTLLASLGLAAELGPEPPWMPPAGQEQT